MDLYPSPAAHHDYDLYMGPMCLVVRVKLGGPTG